MNKDIFIKIFKLIDVSDSNIDNLLKVIENIFNEYGEDFKIPALSDNTELYIIKDKDDYFTLESFLINRIVRNFGNRKRLNKESNKEANTNIEINFLNDIHIKNYIEHLKRENSIKSLEDFREYFNYILNIRDELYKLKYKNLVSKKNLKDHLKVLEVEFAEPSKKYKKRAGEEDIEISSDTTIDEVILKSKKKNKAKEIRDAIERDKELLQFEKETREKQKKFPEGTNKKQIEKANIKRTYKERFFNDLNKLILNKYNIYLFSNLSSLTKTPEEYIKLFKNKIGKQNIFENIFLESIEAYEIFENEFLDKVKSLNIPGSENESAYLTVNKILNEVEYGNEITNKISMGRLKLIFLEDMSQKLTDEYLKENEAKELEKQKSKAKENKIQSKQKNLAENENLNTNINNKNDEIYNFVENLMADYLITENKYQVSRRNEDEDYFVDLIFNIIEDVNKVKDELVPVNGLYDKSKIRKTIRMLVTAKLISFENIEEKNFLKKLLDVKEMQNIIIEIRKNPYITALHRVAEHANFSKGTEEITRLEHDRKRFDDNIKNISNLDELISSYQKIIENIKSSDKTSVTLNANKDQILSNVKNLDKKKENEIFMSLLALIKIIARQNNLYPTEEEKIEGGYKIIIDKKYITYIREDLIKEIENILSLKRSRSKKFENY